MVDRKPVVICNRCGEPIELAETSRKGFTKSIEQGSLWILDARSDRLLPLRPEAALRSIVERASFYLAVIDVACPAVAVPDAAEDPAAVRPTDRPTADGLLSSLQQVVAERQASMPEGSYTTHLFREGLDKIRKKTGEEAIELILARGDQEIISESADLLYHLTVLLQAAGLSIDAVLDRLRDRMT